MEKDEVEIRDEAEIWVARAFYIIGAVSYTHLTLPTTPYV